MSNSVLILGSSGTGKSSSIRNLDPKTTFVISVLDKPLPFKGCKKQYKSIKSWDDTEGNYLATDDWVKIVKCIAYINKSRHEIKTLVIDDIQYVLANEFIRRCAEKSYDKYNELANHYWQIINAANNSRQDLITFFLSHNEIDANGRSKIKTIGKLLDEKITIEGMFTTVLSTSVIDGDYKFITQNDGFNTAKSPDGMFQDKLIPNDLLLVINKMIEYFD